MVEATRRKGGQMIRFRFNWRKPFAWTALAVCLVIAVLLSNLIVDLAGDKKIAGLDKVGLVLLGVISVLAGLIATGDAPWQEADFKSWLRPKPIAMTFVAMAGAFGLLTGVINLYDPRQAVESRPRAIEGGVDKANATLAQIQRDGVKLAESEAPVRARIAGQWGLIGAKCQRGFIIELKADALTIEGFGEPVGAEQYYAEATVIAAKGNELESRGTAGFGKGLASTFSYTGNAKVRALRWTDHSGDYPATDLEGCDG